MRVACPRDPARLRELLREAVAVDGPTAVRFPKATAGPDLSALARMDGVDILHRTPHSPLDVLIVAIGALAPACVDAAWALREQGVGVTVVDPHWVIPINPTLVGLAARHRLVVCVEDGVRHGGIGSRLGQAITEAEVTTPCRPLGLPTEFVPHGGRGQLLASHGLSASGIAETCVRLLRRTGSPEPVGSMP
jgi:1-deoxy-D-xylulose-5-phosphate synthase